MGMVMKRALKKKIHQIISSEITPGTNVLDLGCGDGSLLQYLINSKQVAGHGIEINTEMIVKCIEKGIPVIQKDLNKLPFDFPDNLFDVVILNQTIQEVQHPDQIISEMLRIGREGILGFPNFGALSIRLKLLFSGRMPVTPDLPNEWYNTPNIHLLTYKDFIKFCRDRNIRIIKKLFFKARGPLRGFRQIKFFPNLRADIVLVKICAFESCSA
jgi:methionine biosynthesis protein MetW